MKKKKRNIFFEDTLPAKIFGLVWKLGWFLTVLMNKSNRVFVANYTHPDVGAYVFNIIFGLFLSTIPCLYLLILIISPLISESDIRAIIGDHEIGWYFYLTSILYIYSAYIFIKFKKYKYLYAWSSGVFVILALFAFYFYSGVLYWESGKFNLK